MKDRLLFITRHRLNENNGGANGSKGFIHCFAALFEDMSLICPAFDGETKLYIPSHVKVFPYYDYRSKIRKGLEMWCGRICANNLFVKHHLRQNSYDIIVIDHSIAGASLVKTIKATGAKVITIHHNVERDYLRDNRKEHSLLYRMPYLHFAMKAERECLQYSDLNLTVTEKDAKVFSSWYDCSVDVCNWGNFEYREIVDKTFSSKKDEQTFIITGSLYFVQSFEPIVEFIQQYWPIVCQRVPQAKLIVAGRNPHKELEKECEGKENIRLIANPEDIQTIVQQANYYICPIHVGSGRKLRVLDGLKQGLPVLCHEVASSGYEEIMSAGCLYSYHDEKSFSLALNEMLISHVSPDMVYKIFKETFSIERGVQKLSQILLQEKIIHSL